MWHFFPYDFPFVLQYFVEYLTISFLSSVHVDANPSELDWNASFDTAVACLSGCTHSGTTTHNFFTPLPSQVQCDPQLSPMFREDS